MVGGKLDAAARQAERAPTSLPQRPVCPPYSFTSQHLDSIITTIIHVTDPGAEVCSGAWQRRPRLWERSCAGPHALAPSYDGARVPATGSEGKRVHATRTGTNIDVSNVVCACRTMPPLVQIAEHGRDPASGDLKMQQTGLGSLAKRTRCLRCWLVLFCFLRKHTSLAL